MEQKNEYKAELTWSADGEPNIYGGIFSTMDEAVEHIETWADGKTSCQAWINRHEVFLRNGRVVSADHQPLCANPEWRKLFASEPEKLPPMLELPESATAFVAEMNAMLLGDGRAKSAATVETKEAL